MITAILILLGLIIVTSFDSAEASHRE